VKPCLDESQFEAIAELVRARTGLLLTHSRRPQAEAAIQRAMEASSLANPERFIQFLHGSERAFQDLVERLTVAETYFFREREQFEAVRQIVLPELQRSLRDRRLCLWSAGCATGEEAYSLAIVLEQEGLAEQASIVATDISRAALSHARKGVYGAWSFRDVPAELINRYFRRQDERLVLVERIRRLVEFDTVNLAAEVYPPHIAQPAGLDLILCRNVLIYFGPDAVERVAMQMFATLRDGGWLIAGPSDPPLWQHAPFETVLTPAGVLYRRNDSAMVGRKRAAVAPAETARCEVAAPAFASCASGAVAHKATPTSPPAGKSVHDGCPAPTRNERPATEDRVSQLLALVEAGDPQQAAAAVSAALDDAPLSAEIHYLQAVTLMSGARYEEAVASLRRAIYLDRSMAVAHFALASIHLRRGAVAEARRCYRNVLTACGCRHASDVVPFSNGEPTGRLVEAARAQLARIGAAGTGRGS